MRRVLITGSRDWTDELAIIDAITNIAIPPSAWTLVHGDSRGADRIGASFAAGLGMTVEAHPADWDRYGRSAGFRRNAEMVNLGADVCLAFIRDDSRGATMTADMAEKAGIRTIRMEAP